MLLGSIVQWNEDLRYSHGGQGEIPVRHLVSPLWLSGLGRWRLENSCKQCTAAGGIRTEAFMKRLIGYCDAPSCKTAVREDALCLQRVACAATRDRP